MTVSCLLYLGGGIRGLCVCTLTDTARAFRSSPYADMHFLTRLLTSSKGQVFPAIHDSHVLIKLSYRIVLFYHSCLNTQTSPVEHFDAKHAGQLMRVKMT